MNIDTIFAYVSTVQYIQQLTPVASTSPQRNHQHCVCADKSDAPGPFSAKSEGP